jgi:hypothetical protein
MKDARPDVMFVSAGGNFVKQYAERGLDKTGIKVFGPDRDGRRSAQRHGRRRARHRHRAYLFRGPIRRKRTRISSPLQEGPR